jgi:enoyl-CoA hydratase/carnithine racemase
MTESNDVVLYEVQEGIAQVTLNRPDALNAWIPELGRAYFDRLEEADSSPDVRVIVVTGAGRGFCAGVDFGHLRDIYEGRASSDDDDSRPQSLPRSLRKPVIAAINGGCAGLGFVMALMCDIRFAARGAKLTTAFARRGLVAEYGLSWILPRLLGPSRALDILLSGRTVIAEEAHAMGLVDRLAEPGQTVQDAREYAAELIRYSSPSSMATIKRQVYDDLDRSFAGSMASAIEYMAQSFDRPDFREGVESFVEHREPSFEGLGSVRTST